MLKWMHLCNTFLLLQDYMPLPPEGEGEAPKLQFSIVESALFTFHQLGRKVRAHVADS